MGHPLLLPAVFFAIDVAAYAVMSNHYHLVVWVDVDRAAAWSDEEVLQRWTQVFAGPLLVQRYLLPQARADGWRTTGKGDRVCHYLP